MTAELIKRQIIMQKESQIETVKRPVSGPKNPNKKVYVKKGAVSTGRPQAYTKKIARKILTEIMMGKGLLKITKMECMPSVPTIYTWLNRKHKNFNEDFFNSYRDAREIQAELLADQINDIADDGSKDIYIVKDKNGNEVTKINYDNIRRSKLRCDSLRWTAAHLLPRKYGSKMILTEAKDKSMIPVATKIIVNFARSK